MQYIKRSIEDLVRASDKTFKCVLVTGARQTGKSTMLKTLFPNKKEENAAAREPSSAPARSRIC